MYVPQSPVSWIVTRICTHLKYIIGPFLSSHDYLVYCMHSQTNTANAYRQILLFPKQPIKIREKRLKLQLCSNPHFLSHYEKMKYFFFIKPQKIARLSKRFLIFSIFVNFFFSHFYGSNSGCGNLKSVQPFQVFRIKNFLKRFS